jgi:hypothetical protein
VFIYTTVVNLSADLQPAPAPYMKSHVKEEKKTEWKKSCGESTMEEKTAYVYRGQGCLGRSHRE